MVACLNARERQPMMQVSVQIKRLANGTKKNIQHFGNAFKLQQKAKHM
jgi:hypothetical protein